jgi:hypothetical protein
MKTPKNYNINPEKIKQLDRNGITRIVCRWRKLQPGGTRCSGSWRTSAEGRRKNSGRVVRRMSSGRTLSIQGPEKSVRKIFRPDVNVIKLFFSSPLTLRQTKLEYLSVKSFSFYFVSEVIVTEYQMFERGKLFFYLP